MDFSLTTALEVLNRTPGTLKSMLSGLPSPWTSATEGPDTWSPQDVVGHLIHGEETDWIPRAKIILTKGESQAFEPFDRDRKSTRLNSSHTVISYAVFCLKKKKKNKIYNDKRKDNRT